MLKNIKKIFEGIVSIISGCAIITLIVSWLVTFIALSYGLAIWSTQWLWGLI